MWGQCKRSACREQHRAYFEGSFTSVNIYDRAKLRAGNRIRGPAIITQMDATTVIHPKHTGEDAGRLPDAEFQPVEQHGYF